MKCPKCGFVYANHRLRNQCMCPKYLTTYTMAEQKMSELPLFPEGRTTKTPTAMRILEAFSDLCWYEFEGTKEQAVFPIKLSALQKQLLRLLDLPENFYN